MNKPRIRAYDKLNVYQYGDLVKMPDGSIYFCRPTIKGNFCLGGNPKRSKEWEKYSDGIRGYSEKPKIRISKPLGCEKFVVSFSYIPNPDLIEEYKKEALFYLLSINSKSLN